MIKAVCCDLLTGLLDSWTLWNAVAGDAEVGMRWRAAYLAHTYRVGTYRPYETLLAEAAATTGLSENHAKRLIERYDEVQPWPEAADALRALRREGVMLAVVTNCSDRLGRIAVRRVGVPFDAIVVAERVGFYKPHPRPYLTALEALEIAPAESLFLAGSAYDLIGAAKVGMPTYWHNRIGAPMPPDAPPPLEQRRDLDELAHFVIQARKTP